MVFPKHMGPSGKCASDLRGVCPVRNFLFFSRTLRVREKITWPFGGSATGPVARRERGSGSAWILDRRSNEAGGPVAPRPGGWEGGGGGGGGVRSRTKSLTSRAARGRPPPEGWGALGLLVPHCGIAPQS